ncbi:hypothetical protein B0H15DRAFT_993904 [Mycena belliarum]|uniref:Uncharacterized protein n=1 Tax=Mycena belliarum TaxID=1033014 RepID=A0AAD6XLB1_9AGAR|nr:hypothetical protein B0H15DRAFT_993904 [Mycena belliae]
MNAAHSTPGNSPPTGLRCPIVRSALPVPTSRQAPTHQRSPASLRRPRSPASSRPRRFNLRIVRRTPPRPATSVPRTHPPATPPLGLHAVPRRDVASSADASAPPAPASPLTRNLRARPLTPADRSGSRFCTRRPPRCPCPHPSDSRRRESFELCWACADPGLRLPDAYSTAAACPTAPSSTTDGLRPTARKEPLSLALQRFTFKSVRIRAPVSPPPATRASRAAAWICAQSRDPPIAEHAQAYDSRLRAAILLLLCAGHHTIDSGVHRSDTAPFPASTDSASKLRRAPTARPTPTPVSNPSRAAKDEETCGATLSQLARVALRMQRRASCPFSFARPYHSVSADDRVQTPSTPYLSTHGARSLCIYRQSRAERSDHVWRCRYTWHLKASLTAACFLPPFRHPGGSSSHSLTPLVYQVPRCPVHPVAPLCIPSPCPSRSNHVGFGVHTARSHAALGSHRVCARRCELSRTTHRALRSTPSTTSRRGHVRALQRRVPSPRCSCSQVPPPTGPSPRRSSRPRTPCTRRDTLPFRCSRSRSRSQASAAALSVPSSTHLVRAACRSRAVRDGTACGGKSAAALLPIPFATTEQTAPCAPSDLSLELAAVLRSPVPRRESYPGPTAQSLGTGQTSALAPRRRPVRLCAPCAPPLVPSTSCKPPCPIPSRLPIPRWGFSAVPRRFAALFDVPFRAQRRRVNVSGTVGPPAASPSTGAHTSTLRAHESARAQTNPRRTRRDTFCARGPEASAPVSLDVPGNGRALNTPAGIPSAQTNRADSNSPRPTRPSPARRFTRAALSTPAAPSRATSGRSPRGRAEAGARTPRAESDCLRSA